MKKFIICKSIMDGFDLYREAKDQYEKLIPDKNEGLILISLYSKYKDLSFSEENIITIINNVFKDQGNQNSRMEFNRNNTIILHLQESFLWRNEIKNTYRLKNYALELCSSIETRLIDKYNPSKIKRFFLELHNSLKDYVEKDIDFNQWIEDHFDIRMPVLTSQIEILDHQVNDSVKDFKTNIKTDDQGIIDILHGIEIRLEIIKEQAQELKNAFQISYDIDEMILNILERDEGRNYLYNIQKVQSFHESSRSQLEQVSKRIEKIKPKLREFIYDFNKGDFDRKTTKFINYLLNYSFVDRENQIKKVILPEPISPIKIKSKENNPKFHIIPIREISPKLPIQIVKRNINEEKQKELLAKAFKWKQDKERILYWSNIAFHEIDTIGKLFYTELFFKIIDVDNFKTAIKTTQYIMRKCNKNKNKYSIEIIQEEQIFKTKPQISIWKINIFRN